MNLEKEMVEKRNDLIVRAKEIVNTAETEKRELTDAEAQELAEIRDDVRKIKEKLNLLEEVDLMDEKTVKEETRPVEEVKVEENKEVQETRAFENYVRGIVVNERQGELTKADNCAVIPTTIANRIITKVYDICPILDRSQHYNVKGNLELPYYDVSTSSINVAYATEFTALTSASGTFNKISLTGFLAGALVKISNSLINNSQFDIVGFIIDEMAKAISRFIEGELLKGTVGKVTGLSTLTNVVTTASSSVITGDEVIRLKDTVKDAFQNNSIFIMSNATRTALRLLKDEQGRYLLNDDISSPFGTTLLGKPVYVSDNMDDIGAGKSVIYYGDMKCLAVKFAENINIQVLREKYAVEHATGVIGWVEVDGKVQDEQGLAVLKMQGSTPSV